MWKEFLISLSFPKYTITWNLDNALTYINNLSKNTGLSLEQHWQKPAILLWFLLRQRNPTKTKLSIYYVTEYTFFVTEILRTTHPGLHQPPLEFLDFFPINKKLRYYKQTPTVSRWFSQIMANPSTDVALLFHFILQNLHLHKNLKDKIIIKR